MIIESKEIKTDPETGAKIIVRGRSFESTLNRRIILKQILINGSVQAGIHTILNQNVVDCEFPQRNFPDFVLSTSTNPLVTGLTMMAQYYTEYVLDVIMKICREASIGFRIYFNASNQFVFTLYAGTDRSYNQITKPFVVFSSSFDNLISSNYYETKAARKNWAVIAGYEGLANWNTSLYGRLTQIETFGLDGGEGLALREMFVDASSLATMDYNTSTPLPEADYISQLEELGYQELAQRSEIEQFDAEIDVNKQYTYKSDFFLGDIVQYIDDYGHSSSARIIAITTSESLNGRSVYPTLSSV
jgi:hypothetical protein